jgi:pimeloyl-ACP methyl ester carboxylesterase
MSTQQTALTKFLEVDGINYAYRLIGNATQNGNTTTPPLLLLNHIRSTIDLWDPAVVNPLSQSRQVILYDYAGNGHSGGPIATSISTMTSNLIAFLTALLAILHVTQVDVLGFSIGGYVGQQLVLDAPNLVNKLILSGTQPSLGPELLNQAVEIDEIALTPVPNAQTLQNVFNPPTPSSQQAAAAWVGRIMERSNELPAGETFANFLTGDAPLANLTQAYLGWSGETSPYALLPTISKETLVTAGHSDALIPTQNSLVLSQRLTNAFFLTYPDSGHGHLFQFADLYTRQVVEFLDGKWGVGATGGGK